MGSESICQKMRRECDGYDRIGLTLRDPPELLDAALRVLCEGFKLAYAEFLLRCELYGIRATLLQYSFVDSSEYGAIDQAGGVGKMQPAREQRSDHLQNTIKVCVACASSSKDCPSCRQIPIRPLCAYCRLTIKGERVATSGHPLITRSCNDVLPVQPSHACQVLPCTLLRLGQLNVSRLLMSMRCRRWYIWQAA